MKKIIDWFKAYLGVVTKIEDKVVEEVKHVVDGVKAAEIKVEDAVKKVTKKKAKKDE